LSKKYHTKATIGNLNNHIGVPLTLLSFTKQTEIGIVEMGANHQKEIEFLCSIAQPDFGYITNFGKAHLEGFGGLEGVIKGKSEMYEYFISKEKLIFVNFDDAIQVEKTKNAKTHTFGFNKSDAAVNISEIKANPFVSITYKNEVIASNLIGLYNANNISAAITIGTYFGVPLPKIKEAIEGYVPENNRSQLIKKNSNEIILDAYNANPSSMAVAIANFLQLEKPLKVAILGDMFELGEDSLEEHKGIRNLLSNESQVTTFFIGNDFYQNKIEKENLHFYETFDSFLVDFKKLQFENHTILIKGSRGMAMERILEFL
jgi:UDP-N-acetylmuramoyl-tripeptide--D-alanyl-D-alanine ligase